MMMKQILGHFSAKLGEETSLVLNNYSYINILPKSFVDLPLSPQRMTVSLVMQHLTSVDMPQEVLLKMNSELRLWKVLFISIILFKIYLDQKSFPHRKFGSDQSSKWKTLFHLMTVIFRDDH